MIRINLLKAQKQFTELPKETLETESESPGFFEKLFFKGEKQASSSSEMELSGGKSIKIKAIVNIIIFLITPIGMFIYQEINIPKLKSLLAAENAKLVDYSNYNLKSASLVAEIKKHKENKVLIEKQISSLDGLSKVRSKYVRALDLIQTNIPDKMWLTELKSEGDNLTAKGVSYSDTEISEFLSRVGKSVFFSDVSLASSEDSKEKQGDRVNLKKFQINFNLEVVQ